MTVVEARVVGKAAAARVEAKVEVMVVVVTVVEMAVVRVEAPVAAMKPWISSCAMSAASRAPSATVRLGTALRT